MEGLEGLKKALEKVLSDNEDRPISKENYPLRREAKMAIQSAWTLTLPKVHEAAAILAKLKLLKAEIEYARSEMLRGIHAIHPELLDKNFHLEPSANIDECQLNLYLEAEPEKPQTGTQVKTPGWAQELAQQIAADIAKEVPEGAIVGLVKVGPAQVESVPETDPEKKPTLQ